jgi:ribosomal-protein-alanine N-acetyltransferase
MELDDIPQVVAIDNQSFDPPWSERSYVFEISESSYSHMVVLADDSRRTGANGWRRWLRRWSHTPAQVLGYGGLWHIAGEGHISTIAAHPQYRGYGYGEALLAAMIHRAITLQAEYVVLEVRVSNTVAQNLYRKYEFSVIGTKPHYYRSNNEDAYEMRLDLNDEAALARFEQRFASLKVRVPLIDLYSTAPSPKTST